MSKARGVIEIVAAILAAFFICCGILMGCASKTEESSESKPEPGEEIKTEVVKPIELTGISAEDAVYVYDGNEHGIEIKGVIDGDKIEYWSEGEARAEKYAKIDVGEYTVKYRVEREGVGEYESEAKLKILPKISGEYVNETKGKITVTDVSVIINSVEYGLEYGVDGKGVIATDPAKEITVKNNELEIDGSKYTLIQNGNRMYRIEINDETVYAVSEAPATVELRFENTTARVMLNGNTVTTVTECNYCESVNGVELHREYTTSDVEFEITGNETTKIELSLRGKRTTEVNDKKEIYDGTEKCAELITDGRVLYKASDGKYTEHTEKHTQVGEYEYEAVILRDECLPELVEYTLRIVPNLSGVYGRADGVIEIDGFSMTIDGTEYVMDYDTQGKGEADGKEFEVNAGVLRMDDKEYEKCGVLEFRIQGDRYILCYAREEESNEELRITQDDWTITVTNADDVELMRAEIGVTITGMSIDGETIPDFYGEYILCPRALPVYCVVAVEYDE